MAGSVQKWAAATVAAGVCTGMVCPAPAAGGPFAAPRPEPGEVRWDGADAHGRWSLVAGARHAAGDDADLDPASAVSLDPALDRHAIAREAATGRLALDATRAFAGGDRLDFHVAARRSALLLRDDTGEGGGALDARASSRALRSQLDLSLAWSQGGRWAFIPWTRTLSVRLASETDDARTAMDARWNGTQAVLRRDDSADHRLSIEGRQAFDLVRGLSLETALRLERHRLQAATAMGAPFLEGATQVSPRAEIRWTPAAAFTAFARVSRGPDAAGASWLARDPLRGGLAVGPDPLATAESGETGARWSRGPLAFGLSAWRSTSRASLAFTGAAALASEGDSTRHGMALDVGWRPASALDLRAALYLDRSRAADGPRLPGAPQVFGSAGATLRMSRDWDAKLRVNYLGPRDAIEAGESLRSATLANLELVRWLGRTTRISLDVFNVFNQRLAVVDGFAAARAGLADGTGDSFLSSPSEPRAVLLKFRTRF